MESARHFIYNLDYIYGPDHQLRIINPLLQLKLMLILCAQARQFHVRVVRGLRHPYNQVFPLPSPLIFSARNNFPMYFITLLSDFSSSMKRNA